MRPSAEAQASMTGGGRAGTVCLLQAAEPPGMLDAVVRELGKVAEVVVARLPGFDGSPIPKAFSSVDDLAYSQLDYLEKHNLQGVVLVGVSFAAWVALEMAVRSTERISHLVIGNAFGVRTGHPLDQPIADIYAMDPQELRAAMFADESLRSWSIGDMTDEQVLCFTRGQEAQVLLGWNRYMHNPVLGRWLNRIAVPSLVLWGEDDGVVASSIGRHLVDELPNAVFSAIEGAGHYPHIERPDVFAQRIAQFAGLSELTDVQEPAGEKK